MWEGVLQNFKENRRYSNEDHKMKLEAVQICGELEVEIIKVRREVERMRVIDDKKEVADEGANSDLQDLKHELETITSESDKIKENLEYFLRQNTKMRIELRPMKKEHMEVKDELDRLNVEARTLKVNRLNLEAEMEQMAFFHDEMRVLLEQFIMNEKLQEMELEKDLVAFRKQEEEYKSTIKDEIPQLHDEIQHLEEQLQQVKAQCQEVRLQAQSTAEINDELNKDLDLLKAFDSQHSHNHFFLPLDQKGNNDCKKGIQFNRNQIVDRWSVGDSTANKKSMMNHRLRMSRRRSYSDSDLFSKTLESDDDKIEGGNDDVTHMSDTLKKSLKSIGNM